MPRVLLDTHSFLWFVTADPKLSGPAQRAIATGSNEPLLSVASIWEMAIKVSIKRLPIPEPLETFIPTQLSVNRIGLLPIELRHVYEVAQLPLYHRDPFDRLLLAQALVEGITLVSADATLDRYSIQRLW
jgi:PIN domain nuclease of toxin-antitoxin system